MQIQKVIEMLGYKPNEAKVYLVALSLGESHISDIAARAGIPRTTAQAIVDKLQKAGLMHFYVQRRYKYWVAESPERLLSTLQRREEAIRSALPALSVLRRANKKRKSHPEHGAIGIFRMMADATQKPILITNESAEIEYVNAAWEEQFGYTLAEVRGENPRIFHSGTTPKHVYDHMWSTLLSGGLFQSDEIVDKRKDGSTFNLLTTIFSVTRLGHLYYIQILDDVANKKTVLTLIKAFGKK